MAVVNTNINSSVAQQALVRNERSMNTAMERLSTGQRINSAADDAAGLAISSRMTSQIKGLETGIRNANDAISMVNTAEGALIEVTNMLQRMRELALQASNGTTTSDDRGYLDKEYKNLAVEIERVANNTQWNGRAIIQGDANAAGDSSVKYQVGANGGQTIAVDFGDISKSGHATFSALGLTTAKTGSLSSTTTASALLVGTSAVVAIDSAITAVNTQRAPLVIAEAVVPALISAA